MVKPTFLYRFLLFGWLFLLVSTIGFAQKITLNGTVTDAKTALPLEGVSVQISGGKKVALTKAEGTFSLQTDTVFTGATLSFSHLSYQTLTLKAEAGQTHFNVKLQPKNNTIAEVKITASKKLKPEKIRPETIVDYALNGNQVFVLAWERKQQNPSLLVLDRQTDTLQFQYRLPFYTEKLFVDCLDNVHLITETQAFQLHSDSLSLTFYPPENKALFERMLIPCQAATKDKIYFKKEVNNGIIASFYAINRTNQEIKLLYGMQDEEILKMQLNEARFQINRARMAFDEEAKYVNMDRLNRGSGRSSSFGQKIMFEAPYVPLLLIGEQIYLFDHANGKLGIYKNDSLQRVLAISYHLKKNFAHKIIVDELEQKTYALFQKNGLYELKLLNLENGETGISYCITNPFASKISVWNGQVYFLYKDPQKQNRQFLYKASLSNFQNSAGR